LAQGQQAFSDARNPQLCPKDAIVTLIRRFAMPLLGSLALLTLSACGQQTDEAKPAATEAPDAKPGISVADGTFMLPVVAGNPGAAYFALSNDSANTVSIAAIAIAGVGKTEVHQTMGGSMKPVDRIDVEPKIALKFERGGLHVMAFELEPRLEAGQTTEMTITFTDGDKVSAPLKIEAMGAAMDHSGSDH
jgi:periplasmic copper chaperone A